MNQKKIKQSFKRYTPKANQEFKSIPKSLNIKILLKATVYLDQVYQKCNPNFKYDKRANPKRVLTRPDQGTYNDGFDNADNDYILRVNDTILNIMKDGTLKAEYLIIEMLGKGTFGQVVKCQRLFPQTSTQPQYFAIKVIKNKPAYFHQGKLEVRILKEFFDKLYGKNCNPNLPKRIIKMTDAFIYRKHLFIVSELLDISLYDLLSGLIFTGLSMHDVSSYVQQILEALIITFDQKIIHCDLKPENILFIPKISAQKEIMEIKVIDFGSAC